jgi:cytochrome c oxidase assembly protein subunit 11
VEPDATDDVVQASLGFGAYEHAPRAEVRNAEASPKHST